jgi:Bacterial DNA polymerase III alpha subunit finger domain
MPELIAWPFPLPERFTERLGYERTVESLRESGHARPPGRGPAPPRRRRAADLMAPCAIIRPRPVQGGMVHPYHRGRAGTEPVRSLHPGLEPILRPTLGIFLYQEQVLVGVSAPTGCTAGEATASMCPLAGGPAWASRQPARDARRTSDRRSADLERGRGGGRAPDRRPGARAFSVR